MSWSSSPFRLVLNWLQWERELWLASPLCLQLFLLWPSRLAKDFTEPSQCGDLGLGQERLARGWDGEEEYKERTQEASYLTRTFLN